MLISIIIPTYNSEITIQSNLDSIKEQTYTSHEIIVLDNNSSDETINLIKKNNFKNIRIIIEQDNGIYDAINKGIIASSGDLISILHSDDTYYDTNVLKNVVNSFGENNIDIVYGDLVYVKKNDTNYILRYWKPGVFRENIFLKGWQPPHPSFFAKKKLFISKGLYKTEIGNSADVELMYRFLQTYKIKSYYLNKTLVKMRYGGTSNKNIRNIIKQNFQIIKFLKIYNNLFKVMIFFICKLFERLKQFVVKK